METDDGRHDPVGDEERPAGARPFHRVPDLDLAIRVVWQGNDRAFQYELTAADPGLKLYGRRYYSGPLENEADVSFARLFGDIEALRLDSARDRRVAARRVGSKGSNLLRQLVPEDLQRRLWGLRDAVTTVQVQADDRAAAVPWELVKLRPPDGEEAAGAFLCETFECARWLPGLPKVRSLRLCRPALVVPDTSRLRNAPLEREAIRRLFARHDRAAQDVPAHYEGLLDALAAGEHDCWHFTGHGLARGDDPDTWLIGLDGREPLRPEDLTEAQGFGGPAPLVFLNACHSGRGRFALTTLGGWAGQCLRAGAAAFLGCHWAVPDDKAREFAFGFYRRLLAGAPIGRAVRETRLELRNRHAGDPTWLAYTLFADPLAARAGEDSEVGSPPAAAPAGKRVPRTAKRAWAGETPAAGPPTDLSTTGSTAAAAGGDLGVGSGRRSGDPTAASPRPGDERVHEPDGTPLLFVPGGDYILGDDAGHEWSRPAHRVTLSPFWIGKVPVTNRQYARYLKACPDVPRPAFWTDPRFDAPEQPVVGVSWSEAVAYCEWAALALPTEAQWEAAARGTDRRRFPWGDQPPEARRANFGNHVGAPTPVGVYRPGSGPFGVLDQAGNVWEWCADAWDLAAYGRREDDARDPIVYGDPAIRAVRGGSWASPPDALETPLRSSAAAKQRLNDQGFRCLLFPR